MAHGPHSGECWPRASEAVVANFLLSPGLSPLSVSLLPQGDAVRRVPSHEGQGQVYSADRGKEGGWIVENSQSLA